MSGWGRPRAADVALSAALLLIAGALFAHYAFLPAPARLLVRARGEVVLTLSLPCERTDRRIESNGFSLRVQAEGMRARVSAADCPDQACVHAGWLTRAGQAAVCLPAQVVVSMESGRPEVDALLR